MTGTMEPFHVDNGTPAPQDGIRFSAAHATSEDRTSASNRTSGQRKPVIAAAFMTDQQVADEQTSRSCTLAYMPIGYIYY